MKKFAIVFAFAFLVLPSSAFAQATRTWVSGVGDDANPCSRTAPCKTWAGAIGKTAVGGEIDALDPGPFGVVSITKSITLDGATQHAGTLASGTQAAILVNIPSGNAGDPNRRVVLRGLSLNGTGTTPGVDGVRIEAAGAVHLENTRIANFAQDAVDFTPTAPEDASLTIDGVTIAENGGNGVLVGAANATQRLNVLVRNTMITGSRGTSGTAGETGIGVSVDTGGHVWLTGTTIFDNLIGLKTFARSGPAGIIDSYCDNQIGGNADNGVAPNPLCPPPPVQTNTVTNNVITPGPVVTNTVTAPERCVVPNLKGLTLAVAKRMLKATNCALGTVTRKKATKAKQVGTVLSQKIAAGKKLAKGSKVAVTVARR